MPEFKKEGRGFKMKGFTPFTQTGLRTYESERKEEDQSHAPRPPLFAKKDITGMRDITKLSKAMKYQQPKAHKIVTGFGIAAGAHAAQQTVKRGVQHGFLGKYGLGKAALGTAAKVVLPLAAIHFGGKLIKGIRNRKEHEQIARHYEDEQRRKRGVY